MNQTQKHRIAKALPVKMLPELGTRALCIAIVILLFVPFQLSNAWTAQAFAAQKLPVLQLEAAKGKPFQSVLHTVEASGYAPRVIREEDFLFNITPQTFRYVLVPLGAHIRNESVAMLRRYVADGGKLVLIPPDTTPDNSVNAVFQIVGLPVSGVAHTTEASNFYWKGLAQPDSETLPANSQVLVFSSSLPMDVLATWGTDYPAIVSTNKGAVLNWQWGRQLSSATNLIALSRVMLLAKPESFILLGNTENQKPSQPLYQLAEEKTTIGPETAPNAMVPARHPALISGPQVQEPTQLVFKGADSVEFQVLAMSQTPTQPASESSTVTKPGAQTAEPAATLPASSNTNDEKDIPITLTPAPTSKTEKTTPAVKPTSTAPTKSTAPQPEKLSNPMTNKTSAKAGKTQDAADDEVLNNILGIPATNTQKQPGQSDAVGQPNSNASQPQGPTTGTEGTAEKPQKHFSFLDPEAADVLAPEFDYGVYSMNMRILEDYRRKIQDAIETLHQLAMVVPQDKVDALLHDANAHKKKFESLYLGGKTTEGLNEFAEARRLTLQALALTTESPKVEGRAIWMDRGSIIEAGNPAELRKRMQKLQQAGINIVYFETVNAGFPIYPSAITKSNPMVQGWDPLKVAVEEGHRLGMEVHAWVWCFAVGNRRHNPLINMPSDYAGPILTEDGLMSEALRNRDGGLGVDGRQNEFWLSPASPKAREFLLNLYKEIVTKYDVDGIQLDYIRYPFQTSGTRMGFESVGREHFHQATGLSVDTLDDYASRMWIAWKTYQVSSFVQQVSTTLKKIKPTLQLSAAVFPMRRESRIVAIQQDWETWINNGWIDTLSPMSYTSDPDRLQGMFEYVQSSPQRHPLVYPGVALHRLDGGQLVMQLEALRDKGSLGATLFAGSHLDKDKIDTLSTGPYKEHNSLPPHHDVVKSLQTILADYQQKFDTLKTKGNLADLPADQAKAIQDALSQLAGTLNSMAPVKIVSAIPPYQFTLAQQQLKALYDATQAWTESDQAKHTLRMQYFAKDVTMLDELLGYLTDKCTSSSASSTAFKAPTTLAPASMVSAQPATPTSSSTSSTANADADKKLQPDAEDVPEAALPN
jgi:uncharacterized lipoprotein YddW (UPF0748 family)